MLISFSKILFLFYAPFLHRIKFSLYLIYLLTDSGLPRSGKNAWKMNFFPGQGKVREFCKWSGKFRKDFESHGKVREFERLCQADLENLFILFKEGKRFTFSCDSLSPSPHCGLLLKQRICSPWSKFFPLRVAPKFKVIQLAPLN